MLINLGSGPNWKWPSFELNFTFQKGLNPAWALHDALAALILLYVIILHAIFGPWVICFWAWCNLWMCLCLALLQHCWRAPHHLVPPCVTCSYIPYLALFLHKLAAPFASVFGPWSELKVALFWPILHVSLTFFFSLVIILYTSCYSTFWASILCLFFSMFVYWLEACHIL